MHALLWLVLDSSFVHTRFYAINVNVFYLYWVKTSGLPVLLHQLLLIILNWPSTAAYVQTYTLSWSGLDFDTLCTFALYRALSQYMPCSTVFAIIHIFLCFMDLSVSFVCFLPHRVKSFVLFMLLSTLFCALCGSTLWAAISILSLMPSSLSSNVVTFLKISFIMPSSSSPFMNCSLSNWSHSVLTFCHLCP